MEPPPKKTTYFPPDFLITFSPKGWKLHKDEKGWKLHGRVVTVLVGGRTEGGGQWPLHFSDGGGGMAPHFFDNPVLKFFKKRYPSRHAVKCLTWWKIVHQIAPFKTTFSKKAPTSEWGTSPSDTTLRRASATVFDHHFWLQKFAPPFEKSFRRLCVLSPQCELVCQFNKQEQERTV